MKPLSTATRSTVKTAPFQMCSWVNTILESLFLRPMVFVLLMSLLGGYAGFNLSFKYRFSLALAVSLFSGLLAFHWFEDKKRLISLLLGITAFSGFFSGFVLWNIHESRLPDETEYIGTARICSANCASEGYKNIRLKTDDGESVIYLTDQCYEYGSTLEIEGKISNLVSSGNPGDMDFSRYYRRNGIVRYLDPTDVRLKSSNTWNPVDWGYRLGARLSRTFHQLWEDMTGKETAGFLSAMIAGDDCYLEKEEKNLFQSSNLAHLLVVSGAHIGYLTATLSALFSVYSHNQKKKFLFLAIILTAYGFLCGWSGSVSRSIFSYILTSILVLKGKVSDRLSACSLSAFLILLIDPFAMFSYGVLLSFGATISISIFVHRVENGLKKILHFLPDEMICAFSCFLCAQFGMMPVMISMGNSLSLLNIFVVVLSGFPSECICSLGLVLTLFCVLFPFPAMGRFLFIPVSGLIRLLNLLARVGSFRTFDRFSYARVPLSLLSSVLGLFLVCLLSPGIRRRSAAIISSFGMLAFVLNGLWVRVPICRIYFLDVGQGDGALLCYENRTILIDGGKPGNGETISRVMDSLGISKIDMALISHLDIDHAGGILELWEMGRVHNLYAPFWGESKEMNELRKVCSFLPDEVESVYGGFEIFLDDDVKLSCLWPDLPHDGGNEDSMVLLFTCHNVHVLFTGDIGHETEERLHSPEINDIQVLKVAHHGSRFSTSEAFLSDKKVDAAVISVGYNHYGHPSGEVLERLSGFQIPYYRTDKGGCILLQISGDSWKIGYYFEE